jgi:acyl carrier protein
MNKIDVELKKIFKNIFKIEMNKINNKTSYKNIKKWDSLNHVKLIMAIESKFRISIDPDEALKLLNFKDILNFLYKK